VCKPPHLHHLVHEPVLRVEARMVEIQPAMRRHRAVLRLDRQATPVVDAHLRMIDGGAEQGRHRQA
jgi:hypothetical protein